MCKNFYPSSTFFLKVAVMKKKFSERYGFTKPREEIQLESVDDALRNRLWNLLMSHYWQRARTSTLHYYESDISKEMWSFLVRLWDEYFQKPLDTLPYRWNKTCEEIRDYFFNCEWYEVYNFLEYIANNYPVKALNEKFMNACNVVLEEELSAYRFVGGQITRITAEEEISEVEEALESPVESVRVHLATALKLMSDRRSPDYRNSIKESISAVEALCKIIAKDEKATLGKALDIIERKIGLHKALKTAFDSLYGYTSSAEGIRHALLDESSLTLEDAKFMLVSCSAFINYLIFKASKAGLI